MRHPALLAAVASLLLAACGSGTGRDEVVVFAAASLTDAFEQLGEAFELNQPGVRVTFSLAGSQLLAQQLTAGADADVVATADHRTMQRIVDAGLVAGEPQVFATNRLVIAVEPGNPHRIEGLADLARDGLVVVLAAEEVPAGRYSAAALDRAGVDTSPASLELDVRQVVAKVALGEADAGIVYASDAAAAAGDVDAVPLPDEHDVHASYPIAALEGAGEGARAFVDFVRSRAGRRVLARAGFGAS